MNLLCSKWECCAKNAAFSGAMTCARLLCPYAGTGADFDPRAVPVLSHGNGVGFDVSDRLRAYCIN